MFDLTTQGCGNDLLSQLVFLIVDYSWDCFMCFQVFCIGSRKEWFSYWFSILHIWLRYLTCLKVQ